MAAARGTNPPTAAHTRGAHTPSVPTTTFNPAQNKSQHASPRWGDSRAARDVSIATADRGGTAPTHAGIHAHRQTQTHTSNTRGGNSVRDRPPDPTAEHAYPQRARRHSPPRKTIAQHASPRWRDSHAGRRVPLATADRGGTAPAHAGVACTRTGRRRCWCQRQTLVLATA